MAQNTLVESQGAGNAGTGNKGRIFWFGIVVVALIVLALFSVAFYTVRNAEADFEEGARQETRNITYNRVSQINNWFRTVLEPAVRFINSDQIAWYAAVIDGAEESANGSSLEDLRLLQDHLMNMVRYSDFNFGGLLNSRGEMYLNTDPAFQTLSSSQRAIAAQVVERGEIIFGPLREDPSRGLQLELYLPVVSGAREDGTPRSVAVLYLTQSVSPKLSDLMKLEGYDGQGYSNFLLQRNGATMQMVDFRQDRVRDLPPLNIGPDGLIPFAERSSVYGSRKVYSQGAKIDYMDLWVLWELDYTKAREALDARISDYYKLAALGALVLVLLVSVIWRWFISLERTHTLARFQELFAVIDEQKRLLDSINGAIAEPISLTDTKGTYLYVNQAFAEAFGRNAESIVGLDTAAVCGFDTARRLNSSDQHVLMTGEKVTTNEVIWLQSKRHYFQISKAPLRDSDSQSVTGIVSVYRDVTKLMEAEEHSHRMVQQTIDALVSTIEQADPFLGGHSRIMGEVAKLLSKGLNLSEKDTATIETAATLSQIGKMFVPREVLTKPGVLTPEEKKVMEQHVEHTLRALGKIEFDLPVLEAIAQMNERMDGKGYPNGLKAGDISIYGRVLAVANAFTAMARPRSYRPAMDVRTVIDTLGKQSGTSYDPHVLDVLRGVLDTPAGEQVVAKAAKSTPV